ncbi:MAG: CBS domain-containing protein, partial [Anaerolineae bacterium]
MAAPKKDTSCTNLTNFSLDFSVFSVPSAAFSVNSTIVKEFKKIKGKECILMKNLLVKDWMVTDVVTANPAMPMLEAHKLMRGNKIRRMPVIGKNGNVVGIITRSDVRQAEPSDATSLNVWEINYLLAKLTVKEIMTADVKTIGPENTIKTAATLLYENRIGALPVV